MSAFLEPSKDNPMQGKDQTANNYIDDYRRTLESCISRIQIPGAKKEVEVPEKLKELEIKAFKQVGEIELLNAKIKKSEEDLKTKGERIEELETKLDKLNGRLQRNPLVPYINVEKLYFSKAACPHDCTCIVCGDVLKQHSSPSGADSPEVSHFI